VDLGDQRRIRGLCSRYSLLVAQAGKQHGDQAPGVGHELLVEAGLGFDVEADLIPDQPVLRRPVLELLVALGGPGRVVDGEVVALLRRKERDADQRDTGLVQLANDAGSLGTEVRHHDHDPGSERIEVLDDRGVGEQLGQARRVQLTGEGQARSCHWLSQVGDS